MLPAQSSLPVRQNRLSYIPETIALLTSLRKLKLKGNQLQDVPDGVCRLHALEELDLSQNALVSIACRIGVVFHTFTSGYLYDVVLPCVNNVIADATVNGTVFSMSDTTPGR